MSEPAVRPLRTLRILAILLALGAGVWYWQQRAAPPARSPSATHATSATSDVRSEPHRGGAMRSVRDALAQGPASRGATAPATSTPSGNAAPHAPAAEQGNVDRVAAASARADDGEWVPDRSATAAGTHAAAAPARSASNPAAHAAAAPAAAPSAAPKTAAELFAPLVADDPNQVFAPATANYHAAVQGETQDPQWGPAASAALRDYITGRFGDRFEIPYVDCRQDLCELQIASRPGGDPARDMQDLSAALQRMHEQPWWNSLGFDQENGSTLSTADERVISLWFFSRK